MSRLWFEFLKTPHHLLSLSPSDVPLPNAVDLAGLEGRSMVVRKTRVVPIECVVRGYLAGSGWKEYRQSSTVCGLPLPAGLRESDRLPETIFTPATKAESGHDENIPFETMCNLIGEALSVRLRDLSIEIYEKAAAYALERGIIIADTKFEFGLSGEDLLLIDEVLTPDSSRFWPVNEYAPGKSPASFDKQFVRNWLEASGWDKNSQPPELPMEIVAGTRERYLEAYRLLVGEEFPWA